MSTNADLIRSLYEAFAHGDVPAGLGLFDPQIEWNAGEGVRYADRDQYTDTAQWTKALGA